MFYSRFLPEVPLNNYLDSINSCFEGIEIGIDPQFQQDLRQIPRVLNTLTRFASKHNKSFTVHGPFFKVCFGHPEQEIRQKAINSILNAMSVARDLGAQKITIHPSAFDQGEHHTMLAEIEKWEEEAFSFLCRHAGEKGLILCLENMPDEPIFPPGVKDFSRMLKLVDLLPRNTFGLTVDVGHALRAKIDIISLLPRLVPWIEHFHLHDNDGSFDQHYAFLTEHEPFWISFWEAIHNIGYKGTFCLEVKDLQGQLDSIEKIKKWIKA